MNRLKELRQKNGDTLEKLSSILKEKYNLNITTGQLSSYENVKRAPRDFKVWESLAEHYNVSVAYFLCLSDNPNRYNDEQVESLGENISAFSYQRYNEGKINKFIAFLDDLDIILSDEQIEYVFYLIESMDLNRILPNLKEASGVDFMDGVDVRLGEEKIDAFYDNLSKAGYTKLVPGLKK